MSRQIVLCFDGTNNKYADRDDTNVIKLYQMLGESYRAESASACARRRG